MKKNRFDVSLVTGASSGIGRSLSIELGKTSSLVYLIGRNKMSIIEIIFGMVFIVTIYYFNKSINKDIFKK